MKLSMVRTAALCAMLLCAVSSLAKLASLGVGANEAAVPTCSLPVTHTYTPGSPGSGAEVVCTNATTLVAEAWGPGAAGGLRTSSTTNGGGGGGGGYASSNASGPFTAGTISYAIGTAGLATIDSCVNGPNGTATTIGGAGQVVALMTANGGQGGFGASTSTGGNGGTATGGTTTNTTGGNGATGTGSAGAGGAGANGGAGGAASGGPPGGGNGTAPGGGGGGAADGTSCTSGEKAGDGAAAQVKFTWS